MHKQVLVWLRIQWSFCTCRPEFSRLSGCSSIALFSTWPVLQALLHLQHLFAEITLTECNYNGQTTFDSADKWLFQNTWSGRKMPVILSHPADPNLQSTVLWIFNCRLSMLKLSAGLQTHRTQPSRCSAHPQAFGTQNRKRDYSRVHRSTQYVSQERAKKRTKNANQQKNLYTHPFPPFKKGQKALQPHTAKWQNISRAVTGGINQTCTLDWHRADSLTCTAKNN